MVVEEGRERDDARGHHVATRDRNRARGLVGDNSKIVLAEDDEKNLKVSLGNQQSAH